MQKSPVSVLLAMVTVVALVCDWRLLHLAWSSLDNSGWVALLVVAYFAIGTLSFVGFLFEKRQAVWAFVVFAGIATVAFSSSLIPFIPQLFPPGKRLGTVIVINGALVLLAIAYGLKRSNARR